MPQLLDKWIERRSYNESCSRGLRYPSLASAGCCEFL